LDGPVRRVSDRRILAHARVGNLRRLARFLRVPGWRTLRPTDLVEALARACQ